MPRGKRKSAVYDFFSAKDDGIGTNHPAYYVGMHADHKRLPTPRVVDANGSASMHRHLKSKYAIVIENDVP